MRKFTSIVTLVIIISIYSSGCKTHSECASTTDTTSFISKDTANIMLSSYLNSINYNSNDSDLFSASIDAAQMRSYLADTSIKRFKIMLAHSLDYIRAGHSNQHAGYNRNALSFIIAGYDANGDYVLYNGNSLINRSRSCPTNCPVGTASSPLIR